MDNLLYIIITICLSVGFVENICKNKILKAILFGAGMICFGYLLRF